MKYWIRILIFTLTITFVFGQDYSHNYRLKDTEDFKREYEIANDFLGFHDGFFSPTSKFSQKKYSKTANRSTNAIIDDFRVNELVGPNGAGQYFSSVGFDNGGNYIIIWNDKRNGFDDFYFQKYSNNGTPVGENVRICDDEYYNQPNISAEILGNGNFLILWLKSIGDNYDLYGKLYSPFGQSIGESFNVSDEDCEFISYPFMASDTCGNFILTWQNNCDGNRNVYAQRYSNDGSKLGDNFQVNDHEGSANQSHPSVSINPNGNFVITWIDDRNGSYSNNYVYAQRYSNDGSIIGANFKVNVSEENITHEYPSISFIESGKFIITWCSDRDGDFDVFAQQYLDDGTPLGGNFKVNDDHGTEWQFRPYIGSDHDGNYLIIWNDKRDGHYHIYAQVYSSDGNLIGTNFMVNDHDVVVSTYNKTRIAGGNETFMISWTDNRTGDWNVYTQSYANNGIPSGSNLKVNDDEASSDQYARSIGVDNYGSFVIIWTDCRYGDYDIYFQQYTSDGSSLGTNVKVNDDEINADQNGGAVVVSDNGNYTITWSDERNGEWDIDIYAQQYSHDGMPIGSNFKVNDDEGSNWQNSSTIAADINGNFIIAWFDARDEWSENIYAQRFSNNGVPIDSNFRVNDIIGSAGQYYPSIAVDSIGNFIIAWYGWYNEDTNIYAQIFSNDGTQVGSNFKVNDDEGDASQRYPSVDIADSGNFIITWRDKRNGDQDIYAQQYSGSGTSIGSNFKVNDDEGDTDQSYPSIAFNGCGNFIISWLDERNGDFDIYAQRYSGDVNPIGENFRLTNTGQGSQIGSKVALWNNKIYNTWTDNRLGGTGKDVWANVLDWNDPTGIEKNEAQQLTKKFSLKQNYPNPFNPSTNIKYNLPKSSFVELTIYNLAGQKVRTLINSTQTAGQQTVVWDGKDDHVKDVPSGVYIYTLKTNKALESKKMLLVR